MEKIEEMTAGPGRMIAILHRALEELKELGVTMVPDYPFTAKSVYGMEINTSSSYIKEMMERRDLELIAFESQTMIDVALQTIARKLNYLFEKQGDIRGKIEKTVGKSKLGKVPRNTIRQLLKEEGENHQFIEEWKKFFSFLIKDAKSQGFEVFERNENKYQIYIALEINLWKATKDTELKEKLGIR